MGKSVSILGCWVRYPLCTCRPGCGGAKQEGLGRKRSFTDKGAASGWHDQGASSFVEHDILRRTNTSLSDTLVESKVRSLLFGHGSISRFMQLWGLFPVAWSCARCLLFHVLFEWIEWTSIERNWCLNWAQEFSCDRSRMGGYWSNMWIGNPSFIHKLLRIFSNSEVFGFLYPNWTGSGVALFWLNLEAQTQVLSALFPKKKGLEAPFVADLKQELSKFLEESQLQIATTFRAKLKELFASERPASTWTHWQSVACPISARICWWNVGPIGGRWAIQAGNQMMGSTTSGRGVMTWALPRACFKKR